MNTSEFSNNPVEIKKISCQEIIVNLMVSI